MEPIKKYTSDELKKFRNSATPFDEKAITISEILIRNVSLLYVFF